MFAAFPIRTDEGYGPKGWPVIGPAGIGVTNGRTRDGEGSSPQLKEDLMAIFNVDNESRGQEGIEKAPSEDGRETQEAFFEVSKVVETPEMLQTWVEWFKRLNIPCAVARVSGGYTLWRKGEEIGRTRAKVSALKRKNIVYSFGV
jgi:hypothetical protein